MIYVSYSREDLNTVYPICKHLLSEGVKLFMDINQASGGGYAQELIKRIESAEAILLFYSNNVENSTWVKHEIEFALSNNKRVIPVLLSEMTDSDGISIISESISTYTSGIIHISVQRKLRNPCLKSGWITQIIKRIIPSGVLKKVLRPFKRLQNTKLIQHLLRIIHY
ncbi:MAG: toll/interleukin-1 receptor domain-containing protein [Bacteroidales bacterium]|nr:toll/interleukin-1 receptor domain-containing protein [Bacteroidales bacterium]